MNKKIFYKCFEKNFNMLMFDIYDTCKKNNLSINDKFCLKKEILDYLYRKPIKKKYTWNSEQEYVDFIDYVTRYFPDFEDIHYYHKFLSNLLHNTDATDIGYIIYKNTTIIEKNIDEYEEDDDFLTIID